VFLKEKGTKKRGEKEEKKRRVQEKKNNGKFASLTSLIVLLVSYSNKMT